MESKTRKIFKLVAILATWYFSLTVPERITHEPPIQIVLRCLILSVPMWIFSRNSSNTILRMVWGFCDQCMNMVMAFEFATTLMGAVGLMLGLMALGAISSVWSICAFVMTIIHLITDLVKVGDTESKTLEDGVPEKQDVRSVETGKEKKSDIEEVGDTVFID